MFVSSKVGDGSQDSIQGQKDDRWLHEGFAMVPNELLCDNSLPVFERMLYALLIMYDFKKTKTCYPSQGTLAKILKCDRGKINVGLNLLKRKGFIDWTRPGYGTCLYSILGPYIGKPRPKGMSRYRHKDVPVGAHNKYNKIINENNNDKLSNYFKILRKKEAGS